MTLNTQKYTRISHGISIFRLRKVEKLIANILDKTEYVAHVKNLKQALNHGPILRKVFRAIGSNQSEWLKPYIDINNELRQKATNDFEKDFFKLMNNFLFARPWKMFENTKTLNL